VCVCVCVRFVFFKKKTPKKKTESFGIIREFVLQHFFSLCTDFNYY